MSHPPDHIPDLESPRQSRSPLKKDQKEKVRNFLDFYVFFLVINFRFHIYILYSPSFI